MDAIELLKRDHQEVTKLFQRFGSGKGAPVVEKICDELDVHSRIEEEIFYPAVREAGSELAREVDEAVQEHARVKQQVQSLREQLRGGAADRDAFAGQVSALEQDVEHHVAEEEGEMFPQVAEAMNERQRTRLGERMQARKGELSGGRARAGRRGERARAARGRAKTTRTRGKAKVRRARTSARRTRARGAKRTTGRARQRKRARARRR
jgi:hemerythrin superfamily protein